MTTSTTHGVVSVRGWSVTAVPEGRCVLRDEAGRVRASYPVVPGRPLAMGEVAVSLPQGEAVLFNGRPGAARRSSHDGHVTLDGRRYTYRHRWWRRPLEVRRDGVLVAVLRAPRGGVRVVHDAVADDTDRLAVALGEVAVRPGREGAISTLLDGLSGL
ncbi:hypothetical protein G5V59_16005 [Nocardioides sp. W3-2-3]|uniref:hypothetical protein n=1 Tax=Nocardioides convexus TaxID=2712224 RepID=UPI00241882B2|nr:hypothetical protein [Nocardioides convexus]NHA00915.1 hypothetical protein [Nocardioides convexus]